MEITELCEYKGDTWQIELDGDRKYYVNGSIVGEYELEKGQTITNGELSRIKDADTLRKAKKRALYLLGERMMCRGELLSKLTKTYGEEIAEQAADYVCDLGYVNDEQYAPKLADYLIKRKKLGVRRARYEMLRRGLDRELVENTLADIPDDEIDEELTALISKKYSQKVSDYDDRRRTIAALARRGYDFGAIKRCIDAFVQNTEDNGEFDEVYDNYED
ncbi:MAG: recombination regulator RecX [Oscillospiraceae bacterium]|nr:recombination regulator RecX [Oscillospiraceae bacterium]